MRIRAPMAAVGGATLFVALALPSLGGCSHDRTQPQHRWQPGALICEHGVSDRS
jgi:hypothetical protein